MPPHPTVHLLPGHERGLLRGLPWVYEKQVAWTPEARTLPAGTVVDVRTSEGRGVATAVIEPGVPIALRCWAWRAGVAVDAPLLLERLRAALALRARLLEEPFHRLIHADADELPGVVCDRYGDVLVLQLAACASAIEAPLLEALGAALAPSSILLQRSGEARWLGKPVLEPLQVPENGLRYLAAIGAGQKTGWYYDQRPHRAFVRRCARGARVLDAFCYSGGFALQAAAGGAASVLAVDRSQPALELAARAAALNGIEDRVRFERADLLAPWPQALTTAGPFDLIVCDPPPLAKQRDKRGKALEAQRRLAHSAATVLAPGGILLQASCSHAVGGERFVKALLQGLAAAGRRGVIIHRGGPGPDHPVHPLLPQSAYLETIGLRVG
jgi:23S rRNA (cytosine1962-C5)-methyltransferase